MKKLWAVIFAAVLVIGAGTTDVLAGAARSCGSYRANCSFIDEDGDGICDNCAGGVCGGIGRGSRHANCAFIDEDGDGICDNCGGIGCVYHDAHGGFLDADNDGICDSCGEDECGGIGCASHHAHGGFLDENNDGICDNCTEGICPQNAVGRGRHHKKGGHHRR